MSQTMTDVINECEGIYARLYAEMIDVREMAIVVTRVGLQKLADDLNDTADELERIAIQASHLGSDVATIIAKEKT
jgi:hypothetical protein